MDHWPTSTRLVAPPDLCDSGTAPVSLKRRQKLSTNDTEKTKLLRSKHSWQRMPWFLNLMLGNKKERISTLSTSLTDFSDSSPVSEAAAVPPEIFHWEINPETEWISTSQAPMLWMYRFVRSQPVLFFFWWWPASFQTVLPLARGSKCQRAICTSQWAAQLPRLGTLFFVLCLLPLAKHRLHMVTQG